MFNQYGYGGYLAYGKIAGVLGIFKDSYGRGAGVAMVCTAGEDQDGALCYPKCKDGYRGAGPVCWQACPAGYRDDGPFCAKPEPYGRGAGYAWQFGDGATGAGPTASHTYAAPGSFTVSLTLTGNGGTTATTSHVVSPTAAAVLAADSFNRTVASGWGNADTGGAWTTSSGASVAPGAGRLTIATPGGSASALLPGVVSSASDVTVTVAVDKVASSGEYFYLVGRRVGTNREYRVIGQLRPDGTVAIGLSKLDNSATETLLKALAVAPGVTYGAGTSLTVRFAVTGTNPTSLRAKVWASGQAEPSAWATDQTDASASLQAAGGVGVRAYLSGSTSNAPVTFALTRFTAVAA